MRIFVKVDGKKFLIGTLSVDKFPQHTTSIVFEKEFELLHTSKTSTISALGFKYINIKRKYPSILHSSIFSKKHEHKVLFLNCLSYLLSHLRLTLLLKKVMLLFFQY